MSEAELQSYGLAPARAHSLAQALEQSAADLPAARWSRLTRDALRSDDPFELHHDLWRAVFATWSDRDGPAPAWCPSDAQIEHANITALMREVNAASVAELHQWSAADREGYWSRAVEHLNIAFRERPRTVCERGGAPEDQRWFAHARLNIVESCFTAAPQRPAIVWTDASGELCQQTYGELRAMCGRIAAALSDVGLGPGSAVGLIMPMTPASVAIYLGIIYAGCTVVGISDSFAAPQIARRLQIADAQLVFVAEHMLRSGKRIELYERLVQANTAPAVVVAGPEGPPRIARHDDTTLERFLGPASRAAHIAAPDAPINVLFSSGTTGDPKAIPWDHTTPIKCAADARFHHDVQAGDVLAWPTSLGWMMGPWLVFAGLMNHATVALYDDAPTTRAFGRFVQDAGVTLLGVVPTLVRSWRQSGCMKGLDWSRLRAFSSTGEASAPTDMLYLMHLAGYRPVIEYCGGTEIGGGYLTSTVVQPNAPSTFSTPALGLDVCVLDDDGQPADEGELFIVPPSVGLSTRLLNADHHRIYHADTPRRPDNAPLRRHGDQFQRLPGGYWRSLGRADDALNLGGIKVSSAEIERALLDVSSVREAGAVGVAADDGGPTRLVIFAVPADDWDGDTARWQASMQQAIRAQLNPLFKIHDVVAVERLPRTASQKLMRRALRERYQKGGAAAGPGTGA